MMHRLYTWIIWWLNGHERCGDKFPADWVEGNDGGNDRMYV